MNNQLSLYDALSFGFRRFIDHIIFIIGVGLLLAALVASVALAGILVGVVAKGSFLGFHEIVACLPNVKACISQFMVPIVFVSSLLGMIMFAWLHLGYIKVMFDIHDNNNALLAALFSQGRKIVTYLVSLFLFIAIVLGGLILLILPGFYFMIRFGFFSYAIVDRNLGPVEALRYSWDLTKGHNLFSLGLWAVFSLLGRVAAAFAFITGGLGYLTLINGYRQLQNKVSQPQRISPVQ